MNQRPSHRSRQTTFLVVVNALKKACVGPPTRLRIIENVGLKCGLCGKGLTHTPAPVTHTRFSKGVSMPLQRRAKPKLNTREPQAGGAESVCIPDGVDIVTAVAT